MQLLLGGWLLGSLALGTYGLMMLHFHEDIKKADQMVMEDTPRASYNGIQFDSKEHMKIYFKMARMDEGHLFKWISVLPEFLILMISACSFGLLGSASMVIREVVMGKGQLLWKNAVWIPVLGAVVGVVVLALATLVPTILVESSNGIRPVTLVFMSFFGGLFIRQFYAWAFNRFQLVFKP